MADPGLLGGIGAGLQGLVSGYKTAKDLQREDALAKQRAQQQQFQQQAEMLTNNLQKDENGNLQLNPMGQKQSEAKNLSLQDTIDSHDPTSQKSVNYRQYAKGLLSNARPGLEDSIPDNMSAAELESKSGLLEPVLKGAYGVEGRQMTSDRIAQSNDIKRQSLDLRKDINGQNVGKAYESDSILQGLKKVNNSLDRAKSIMNGQTPITSNTFAMLQQDLINAVAPGGAATEGKTNRELSTNLASKLNEIQSKFGNIQDLRKDPGAMQALKQISGLIDQVHGDYDKAAADQALNIHDSFKYSSNPQAQQVNQAKLQKYSPDAYEQLYGGGKAQGQSSASVINRSNNGLLGQATGATGSGGNKGPSGNAGLSDQDQAAISWANGNKNDPRAQKILQMHGLQ